MWIGGIKCLVENADIKKNDFIDSDLFRLFEYSDFQILIAKMVLDTLQLIRSDDTGDLYSFVGDANSPLTIPCGYNE